MKKLTVLINDLIDKHGDSFSKCNGCEVCDEIASYRSQLISSKPRRESKVEKKESLKISFAIYQDLKAKGETDKSIAERMGISAPTLSKYKSSWKEPAVEAEAPKASVDNANLIIGYKNVIKDLKDQLAGYQELKTRKSEVEKKNAQLEEDLAGVIEDRIRMQRELEHANTSIKDLMAAAQDLEDKASLWRAKAEAVSADEIGKLQRENRIFREALKEAL
ncbi:hypothetical protein V1498_06745 [Peribacillus sp. SCS-26]|uniref:hypothetical protein n=1 Tax=Paraperibacillus marinus TaxID=3115295 RepID=UPI00390583FE